MFNNIIEESLLVAIEPDADEFWVADSTNESSVLWLGGQLDTESYLDQFAEFGDVDYHVDRMVRIWEYWGLI
jgi:hypothetical protein